MAAADSLVIGGELGRRRPRRQRSEQALIRGVLAGSEADLEALFRRYWPRAYRSAFLIVQDHAAAEDIAQEAFLAAVRRLDRFDRRRRFGPWLSTIVANRAIDWIRARSARRESTGGAGGRDAVAARPAGRPLLTGGAERAGLAIARASGGDRDALPARVQPGRDRRGRSSCRAGTVNSRLRRGLDALESRLSERSTRDETARATQMLRDFRAPDEAGAERRAWSVVQRGPRRTRARHQAPLAPRARARAGRRRDRGGRSGAVAGRGHCRPPDHAGPSACAMRHPCCPRCPRRGGCWCPGRAEPGPRRPTARSATSAIGRRRVGRPAGCTWRSASNDRLAAVDPHGNVRWAVARPDVSDPTWFSPTGYRVAYLSAGHAPGDRRRRHGRSSAGRPRGACRARVAPQLCLPARLRDPGQPDRGSRRRHRTRDLEHPGTRSPAARAALVKRRAAAGRGHRACSAHLHAPTACCARPSGCHPSPPPATPRSRRTGGCSHSCWPAASW